MILEFVQKFYLNVILILIVQKFCLLNEKRKFGESKVNAIFDGFKILMNIIQYYIKSFLNKKLI